jgi:Uri superfamily endonuclease
MKDHLKPLPGTYALLLALDAPVQLEVGRLGQILFESPYYMYVGSAFGPGGLQARISHHTQPVRRLHWHIDYLRQVADVIGIWYSADRVRFECAWANAALALRGASQVPRFGSSDCRCQSHLIAVSRLPSVTAFRRRLNVLQPGCAPIRQLHIRDKQCTRSTHTFSEGTL